MERLANDLVGATAIECNIDVEAKPNDGVIGILSLNVLGRVPDNPIDEIFYENRGRTIAVQGFDGERVDIWSNERVKVYQGSVSWDDRWFVLDAFYRTGHLHWQYEGDFFGLYRDAYYGENVDIYNGEAPVGLEVAGKKSLRGLKVAFGPQLWWGANPAVFVKYQRDALGASWTGIFQEDFTQQTDLTSSVAIPVRETRKASLQIQTNLGPFGVEGEAGCRAHGVEQHRRARRQERLLEVRWRHRSPEIPEARAHLFEGLGALLEGHPRARAAAAALRSSSVGPRPPLDTTRSASNDAVVISFTSSSMCRSASTWV